MRERRVHEGELTRICEAIGAARPPEPGAHRAGEGVGVMEEQKGKAAAAMALLGALIAAAPVKDERLSKLLRDDGASRRTRIHRLHERTGWQLSVCRRVVDTKGAEEIDALVREHAGKGTSP